MRNETTKKKPTATNQQRSHGFLLKQQQQQQQQQQNGGRNLRRGTADWMRFTIAFDLWIFLLGFLLDIGRRPPAVLVVGARRSFVGGRPSVKRRLIGRRPAIWGAEKPMRTSSKGSSLCSSRESTVLVSMSLLHLLILRRNGSRSTFSRTRSTQWNPLEPRKNSAQLRLTKWNPVPYGKKTSKTQYYPI